MKVVLLKDVAKIGKRYDVKNVADGHALNMLIPRGLAEVATAQALKRAEISRLGLEVDKKIQADLLAKNISALESVKIEVKGKANEKGHLFAGIHKEEIVKLLKAQAHIDVLPEYIVLEHPLKEVGDHTISLEVSGKKAKFVVSVQAL